MEIAGDNNNKTIWAQKQNYKFNFVFIALS